MSVVTLRGKKTPEKAKSMVTFRCPPELRRYIDETAPATNRDKTEIITDALELDRDLAVELRPDYPALQRFAEERGLDLDADLAKVLAQLVRAGLGGGGQGGRRG